MRSNLKCRTEDIFSYDDNKEVIIKVRDIKKAYDIEYEKRSEKLFEEVKHDISAQLLATFLSELKIGFGFNKEQLKEVKSGVESLFIAMSNGGIMGQEFTPINCINYMRNEFGIDLDER